MQSGPFTVTREVDAGELAVQSARGLVVRQRGVLFGGESSEVDRFVVGSDRCAPVSISNPPRHTLELRRTSTTRRVHHVLLSGRLTKVLSAVVQTVSVAVVYLFGWFAEKVSVQGNGSLLSACVTWCSTADGVPGVKTARFAARTNGAPVPPRHVGKIGFVDQSEHALRQCDPSSTGNRWWWSCGARSPKSVSVTLRATLVAELSRASGSCPFPSQRRVAFETSVVRSHRSPPSVRSSQAPAGCTARGYFNAGGLYHGIE